MLSKENKHFKWLKIVLMLLLILSLSMAGVTLALYVKQVNLFNGGWIGPKYYAFEVNNSISNQSVAPGQSASYGFTISNYNTGGVAQVPIHVAIEATYPNTLADTGTVRADLYQQSTLLATSSNGALTCAGTSLPANQKTTDTYTLVLTWLDANMTHLGDIKSQVINPSQVSIKVSGYQ